MELDRDDLFFPIEVVSQVNVYVYRLLDPRNGETFYIGKGTGNRVFAHMAGERSADGNDLDERLKRIHEIRSYGFTVQHVIHRHGLDDGTAFEVEGALIDAYSGLTNIAGGHNNADRGAAHARQIIERYCAEDAIIDDKVVEINVRWSASDRNLYDATRFAWRLDPKRAEKADFALAVSGGLIVGVFSITEWMPATRDNFPIYGDVGELPGRYGFIGEEAPASTRLKYLRKKVPPKKRGAANPIRYHNI